MSATQFNSTRFMISQWAETAQSHRSGLSPIELDIIEDPLTREVCSGKDCTLFYDTEKKEYITTGNCHRNSLCTETRIIKDGLYITAGTVSDTTHCINFNSQLKNWK